jgi:mRNA interferase RelE/StbE
MPLTPLRIPRPLKRKLERKPPAMQAAIIACFRQLRENPHHPGLRTSKVGGRSGVFEARVDQKNRVTFFWEGPRIVIENHCNHDIVGRRS